MRAAAWGIALLATFSAVGRADANAPVRYALVVGNDVGVTDAGIELDRLLHAERDAAALRAQLVRFGAFPDDTDHVVMVLGKGRDAILAAARRLAEQRRQDRERWGDRQTMFAFFFTGHGLEGKLLTADEPLTGADLAGIYRSVGATFSFGMFDACFSGSINLNSLRAKGLQITGGFNSFQELPHEVLNSQGTMWVVSSRHDQVSYEDEQLGGLFTHFFSEGLEHAVTDDFGISLEAIWDYASRMTQQYANKSGRSQTPQKMVRELTASGPVYFSFPRPRNTELVFSPGIHGQFLVRYETGELSQVLTKTEGETKRLQMFPGTIWIERIGKRLERQRVELTKGGVVTVWPDQGWQRTARLGHSKERIAPMGESLDSVAVVSEAPHATLALGLGYRGVISPANSGTPANAGEAYLRLDRPAWAVTVRGARGGQSDSFGTWSQRTSRSDLSLALGPALDISQLRLGVSARVGYGWSTTTYGDGAARASSGWTYGAFVDALALIWSGTIPIYVTTQVGVSIEKTMPAALARPVRGDWSALPMIGIGLAAVVY